jgi:hypothetical protein
MPALEMRLSVSTMRVAWTLSCGIGDFRPTGGTRALTYLYSADTAKPLDAVFRQTGTIDNNVWQTMTVSIDRERGAVTCAVGDNTTTLTIADSAVRSAIRDGAFELDLAASYFDGEAAQFEIDAVAFVYDDAALPPTAATAEARGEMIELTPASDGVLTQNRQVASFVCNGQPSMVLNGNDTNLMFRGDCGSISIVGSNNAIDIERVTSMVVSGERNNVRYRSSDTTPVVAGETNSVTKAE